MIRNHAFLAVGMIALLAGGCASAFQPLTQMETSSKPAGETFACSSAMVNKLGYTVVDANKEAGFLRAEKKTSGLGSVLLAGANTFDEITVAVFTDPQTSATTLKLTAATANERAMGIGAGHRNSAAPSAALKADMQQIAQACR